MKLKRGELKLLEDYFELCEYDSDGSCACGNKNQINGKRIWFERSSPEHSDGDFYCDKCGLIKIKNQERLKEIENRCIKVNSLIKFISSFDRKFFNYKEKTGEFDVEADDIFYTDEFNGDRKIVNFSSKIPMDFVNHGSTLRTQLLHLAKFIKTGEKINLFSRYWGYENNSLKEIHLKAKNLGIIESASFINNVYGGKDYIFTDKEVKAE